MSDISGARSAMRDHMNECGMTIEGAAKALQISARLLEDILDGAVTHPKIVARIQEMFCLTEHEAGELISPDHAPVVHQKWRNGHYDMFRADKKTNEYWNYKNQKYKGKTKRGAFGT